VYADFDPPLLWCSRRNINAFTHTNIALGREKVKKEGDEREKREPGGFWFPGANPSPAKKKKLLKGFPRELRVVI